MQFSGKIGQIIGGVLGLAPPPLGNPGSATGFIDCEHPCVLKKLISLTLLILVLVYTHWKQQDNTIGLLPGQEFKEIDETCNLNFLQTVSEQYQSYYNNPSHNITLSSLKRTKQVNMWHHEQSKQFKVTVTIMENKSMFHLHITIVESRNFSQGGASFKLNFEGKYFLVSYSIKDYFNDTYYGCYYLPTDCFTFTVRLLFVNFAAYLNVPPCPLSDVLYQNSWCPSQNLDTDPGEHISFFKYYLGTGDPQGIWITSDELVKNAPRYQQMKNHLKKDKQNSTCFQHLLTNSK